MEPDELGALHLWAKGPHDTSWKRSFSQTYGIKASSLATHACHMASLFKFKRGHMMSRLYLL